MPTQPCFKDSIVPKDVPKDPPYVSKCYNNIPVKQEKKKQQESRQWVLMGCKGCFTCRRSFWAMPPALGIKEPLGTKESELLELSKGTLSYAGVLGTPLVLVTGISEEKLAAEEALGCHMYCVTYQPLCSLFHCSFWLGISQRL